MDRKKGRINSSSMRSRALALHISRLFLPAFFFGCSDGIDSSPASDSGGEPPASIYTVLEVSAGSSVANISHTDVFVFNDDGLYRLDAYQRLYGDNVKVASRAGNKIMVAIANHPAPIDEWRGIGSYAALSEKIFLLQDEDPELPVMSGEIRVAAGGRWTIRLDRLMSEIQIRTLCTDFRNTGYEGMPLTDVKIYLTDVSGSCRLLPPSDSIWPDQDGGEGWIEYLINPGYVEFDVLDMFRTSGMLYKEIGRDIGDNVVRLDESLYCYPCDFEKETPSSPYTKLVIEGKIGGRTCYYPIILNRGEFGAIFGGDNQGIGRNECILVDVTLCRFGTDSPDIPVSLEDTFISGEIIEWEDKECGEIDF